ncbi:MAG: LCP family protein [Clostridia bacterium]|nr:LCP family protein [Clostridia bacterium]
MNHRKNKNNTPNFTKVIPALLLFVILMAGGLFAFHQLDQKSPSPAAESTEESDYVEINGVKCRPKSNLETYLFLGTDIQGKFSDYQGYQMDQSQGQSDMIELLVIDKTKDTYATLIINRNTITDMDIYDEKTLEKTGEFYGQICLAYAFGCDGKEKSCDNTAKAVSQLLYGQKIDGCLALGLDSIEGINHQLGGVTVTIEDDFTQSDPSLLLGQTVHLTDQQAMHFCHDRMNVADGTVENRIKRQKAYMSAAKDIIMEKCKEDETFVLDLYDSLGDYMYTNIRKNQISKIAKAVLKNEDLGEFEIEGENEYNEETEYVEFYPDEDHLAETVIRLFYEVDN